MMNVKTGLDFINENIQAVSDKYQGNIGYLCHSASVNSQLRHGIEVMIDVFGDRLTKLFSPQHGIVSDVQDNMIETDHSIHPYFQLPIYSLYSETRKPTDHMLNDLDIVFIDLQDVGTRIYTYIYTMTLFMEACQNKNIKIVILDRPNPINGVDIEGNILEKEYISFVGRHPLPVRHALTMGEVALMAKEYWGHHCDLEIIKMQDWDRSMSFEQTGLPWVMPSPNLPTVDAAYTFIGSVIFEGTNISEGRGTTRSLEIIGHPNIEAFSHHGKIAEILENADLQGVILRPLSFLPTFQKHAGVACGGYQIHITDRKKAKPWKICMHLTKYFYQVLGESFKWKEDQYEYVIGQNPFDIINGSSKLREWIENDGSHQSLCDIENNGQSDYLEQRQQILLY